MSDMLCRAKEDKPQHGVVIQQDIAWECFAEWVLSRHGLFVENKKRKRKITYNRVFISMK